MSVDSGPGDERLEILAVEDSPTQAELLRHLLEQSGYHVTLASTGAQALALLDEHAPSLVISDVIMPEMIGYELCRRIRADERTRDIPVILLTSLSSTEDVLKGLTCGADSFITKPYSKHYLIKNIQEALANRQHDAYEHPRVKIQINIAGKAHYVVANQQQILTLLLSSYEAAVHRNAELHETQEELRTVNEKLEEKVRDRTAALEADITKSKRTEQALRENEERFRLLVHQANDGIYVHELNEDRAGRFLEVNDSICGMLGYSREEMLAMDVNDIRAPGGLARMPVVVSELRAQGSLVFETENRTKDGRTLPFEVNARLFELQGRTVVLAIARDITERKRDEEQKERLAREAERRKVELEQLIYTASHDLRTPLVSLQGFVGELKLSLRDLLAELNGPDVSPAFRERIVGLVGADIPESLRFIDAGTSRMGALVSGLLRLSRLGRTAFQSEPLDMNHVVGGVARSLEFTTREAGARVEVADLPACLGDPMQVGQIFSNLIENALKYRSPDRNLVVRIAGQREKDTAVYHVEDNGIGITPDQQQHVFTPFFRVDARIPDGEGLGLTIVTRIVERLGGRVWVESELGKGSRFCVALPTR